jgi:hypothetical protein
MATWTQAQRDTLAAAIASGTLAVSYADRSVTYHSLAEMRALLAEMDRQLSQAPTHRLAAHTKGV